MKASIQKPGTSLGSWDLVLQREPEELLTEAEAAGYLKICKRQLYTWRMTGVIPYIKIGKAVRFRRSDIALVLDARTIHNSSEEGQE